MTLSCFVQCSPAAGQCTLRTEQSQEQQSYVRAILSNAATTASSLPDDIVKARLLQRIGLILWAHSEKAEAEQFFECAWGVAARVAYGDPARTRNPFASIDLIYDRARAGDITGALSHAKEFSDIRLQDRILFDVLLAAGQLGKFELAEQVLQSISQIQEKDSALRTLAREASSQKQFVIADRAARTIRNDVDRVMALSDLAVHLSGNAQQSRAYEVFAEAVQSADELPADDEREHNVGSHSSWAIFHNTRDTMLGYIAISQNQAGEAYLADRTLSMIRNESVRAEIRHSIAVDPIASVNSASRSDDVLSDDAVRKLASTGDYEGALALASGIDHFDRVQTLEEIVQTQVERGDTALALKWAEGLRPDEKAPTLLAIAETIVDLKR